VLMNLLGFLDRIVDLQDEGEPSLSMINHYIFI
jgi:hypothetical protein